MVRARKAPRAPSASRRYAQEDGAADGRPQITRAEVEEGDIMQMCQDKLKSRELQNGLLRGGPELAQLIFERVEPYFVPLLRQPSGNYVAQKLLEVADTEQYERFFKLLAGNIRTYIEDVHATRVVQKLVEQAVLRGRVGELLEVLPIDSLNDYAKSSSGFHVVGRMVDLLPRPEVDQLILRLCGTPERLLENATDQWGCCVIKRCIHRTEDTTLDAVVDSVVRCAVDLVQDQYGNYVVQHVLNLGSQASPFPNVYTPRVLDALAGRILDFAQQKYSSNVLEKCLLTSAANERNQIINEILNPPTCLPSEAIRLLIFHPFGNYVLQQALEVAREPQFSLLLELARPVVQELVASRHWSGGGKDEQPEASANPAVPEHTRRLAVKLLKKYPQLTGDLAGGQVSYFDPYVAAAAAAGAAAASADAAEAWDPAVAADPAALAAWYESMAHSLPAWCYGMADSAYPSDHGWKGAGRGKRAGKVPGKGGADVATKAHADSAGIGEVQSKVVARLVGFWPHYTVAYEELPASAEAAAAAADDDAAEEKEEEEVASSAASGGARRKSEARRSRRGAAAAKPSPSPASTTPAAT